MANAGTIVIGLIANIEKFEQGLNTASKKLNAFSEQFVTVKRMISVGFVAFATKSIVDGITEAHIALRKGEDSMYAFVKSIPLLGSITESFHNMYMEVSGLSVVLDETAKKVAAWDEIHSIGTDIGRKLLTIGSTASEESRLKAKFDLEDSILKINKQEASLNEINKALYENELSTLKKKSVVMLAIANIVYPGVSPAAITESGMLNAPNKPKKVSLEGDRLRAQKLYSAELKKQKDIEERAWASFTRPITARIEELAGVDKWTIQLKDFANSVDYTAEKYKKLAAAMQLAKKAERKQLELSQKGAGKKQIESEVESVLDYIKTKRDKMKKELLKLDALKRRGLLTDAQVGLASKKIRREFMPENASGMEYRSSLVSLAGMRIGDKVDEQKTTNELLREQNRILTQIKSDGKLN